MNNLIEGAYKSKWLMQPKNSFAHRIRNELMVRRIQVERMHLGGLDRLIINEYSAIVLLQILDCLQYIYSP